MRQKCPGPSHLLIKQCMLWEYRELSGMVKLPSQIATWLSPKGSEKKQSLYSKQPSACKTQTQALGRDQSEQMARTRTKWHPSCSCCLHCYVSRSCWCCHKLTHEAALTRLFPTNSCARQATTRIRQQPKSCIHTGIPPRDTTSTSSEFSPYWLHCTAPGTTPFLSCCQQVSSGKPWWLLSSNLSQQKGKEFSIMPLLKQSSQVAFIMGVEKYHLQKNPLLHSALHSCMAGFTSQEAVF